MGLSDNALLADSGVRRLPGEGLATVEPDHLSGHGPGLDEEAHGSRDLPGARRALATVGPGPMPFTRTLDASACTSLRAAVQSAALLSV